MQILLFISFIFCEIFQFNAVGEVKKIKVNLKADSINSGFFRPYPGSNMTFTVEMSSISSSNEPGVVLYSSGILPVDQEVHFSFNNTNSKSIYIVITAIAVNNNEKVHPGQIKMKFQSIIDTFNKNVSQKEQIEPAIYALDYLLTKVNNVIISTKDVSFRVREFDRNNSAMMNIIIILSCLTFVSYTVFSALQLYFTRNYLNQKKCL